MGMIMAVSLGLVYLIFDWLVDSLTLLGRAQAPTSPAGCAGQQ
jgi:hypothetical protein